MKFFFQLPEIMIINATFVEIWNYYGEINRNM